MLMSQLLLYVTDEFTPSPFLILAFNTKNNWRNQYGLVTNILKGFLSLLDTFKTVLRASKDNKIGLSTTIYYLLSIKLTKCHRQPKSIVCGTSSRQLNAKVVSCRQLSSFPFHRETF